MDMPDIFVSPPDNKDPKPQSAKKNKSSAPVVDATPLITGGFNMSPDSIETITGHTHNPLAAYSYFPHHVNFIDKGPDEKVILLVRRHIITNIGWILIAGLMIVAPLILKFFPLLSFMPLRFQTVAILSWYLLPSVVIIQGFLSWFFSVNIVTNKRVIDVDFDNLIYRKITDAELDHIEDVTVEMGSVIRTLFDFGNVLIQTAAEVPEVNFWAVPHPDRIDKLLSDLRINMRH